MKLKEAFMVFLEYSKFLFQLGYKNRVAIGRHGPRIFNTEVKLR